MCRNRTNVASVSSRPQAGRVCLATGEASPRPACQALISQHPQGASGPHVSKLTLFSLCSVLLCGAPVSPSGRVTGRVWGTTP